MSAELDAIEVRLKAAAPGPWRWDENYGDANDTGLALTNDAGVEIVGAYNHHCCSYRDDPTVEDNNAEFIAAAPSDVAFLLDLARKQGAVIESLSQWAGRSKTGYYDEAQDDVVQIIRPALEVKP